MADVAASDVRGLETVKTLAMVEADVEGTSSKKKKYIYIYTYIKLIAYAI